MSFLKIHSFLKLFRHNNHETLPTIPQSSVPRQHRTMWRQTGRWNSRVITPTMCKAELENRFSAFLAQSTSSTILSLKDLNTKQFPSSRADSNKLVAIRLNESLSKGKSIEDAHLQDDLGDEALEEFEADSPSPAENAASEQDTTPSISSSATGNQNTQTTQIQTEQNKRFSIVNRISRLFKANEAELTLSEYSSSSDESDKSDSSISEDLSSDSKYIDPSWPKDDKLYFEKHKPLGY